MHGIYSPILVAKSRQLPFRFLSAYDAVDVNLNQLKKLKTLKDKQNKLEKRKTKMELNLVKRGVKEMSTVEKVLH